jgi:hypothetical protein
MRKTAQADFEEVLKKFKETQPLSSTLPAMTPPVIPQPPTLPSVPPPQTLPSVLQPQTLPSVLQPSNLPVPPYQQRRSRSPSPS